MRDADPRIRGPIFRKSIGTIDVAPEPGRLFYTTPDQLGYINLSSSKPPKILGGRQWRTARLAYEPTLREMYVPTSKSGLVVYDAESGERSTTIKLPGWYASMFETVPSKLCFSVANKSGLYVIDAATHTFAPWPKLVTPAYLDSDPTGHYLFATHDRHLVAADIPSAKAVARRVTATETRIAYDAERRRLVVSEFDQPGHPRLRLRAFSVSADGFTEVDELKNPDDGQAGLESFRGGFLQQGFLHCRCRAQHSRTALETS
ncbi:MAG: hypothetical protein HQ485_03445 [Acidobacteria bacterium]|nr:hypothetical protein [Acidobacteriota bacterium]